MIRIKNYIKNNILLIIFIISNLVNTTLLRYFTVNNYFNLKPLLGDLSFLILLGALSYLVKYKNRVMYYTISSILITTLLVIDSMYYTFYMSFSSLSVISTFSQLSDVSDAVVKNIIVYKDFIYIWQVPLLIFMMIRLKKQSYFENILKHQKRRINLRNNLIVSVVIFIVFLVSLTTVDFNKLKNQFNREYLLANTGFFVYHISDIFNSLEPNFKNILGYDNAYKEFREYYDNKDKKKINEYTNIFRGKNIIVIHAESMQVLAMEAKLNNKDITPNLNKLAHEGLYFSNFYSQAGVGTSSDSEFSLNTSLLPTNNGTVFVSYADNYFEALPQLLKNKGYNTFSMHGNIKEFWNRNIMHKNLGYNKFYSKTDYNIDEVVGLGLSDESFFKQSVQIIKEEMENSDKPIYSTLITLSNHTPFIETSKHSNYQVSLNINGKTYPYLENRTLGYYFKSVNYADYAIGKFIEELDKFKLLENSIVVIYGDHDARIKKEEYEYMHNYDYINNDIYNKKNKNYNEFDYYDYELNRKVPFIIWSKNKEINKEITTPMGMVDILPTLGNMIGIESSYALGNDIMNKEDNLVIFPNGNFLSSKIYFNDAKQEFITLNNEAVTDKYVDDLIEKKEEILSVSNNSIIYDLFKMDKEGK